VAGQSASPHFTATAQITLSSVFTKCALSHETVLQTFDVFGDPRKFFFFLRRCVKFSMSALKIVSEVRNSEVRVDITTNVGNLL
jgi:hypothetical protein